MDKVSAGYQHACAIGLRDEVFCWGRGDRLQLGSRFALESCGGIDCRSVPVEIDGFWSMRQVSAGGNHACGLTQNYFVVCWGHNEFGQLGLGMTSVAEFPSDYAGLSKRGRGITAGGIHTCASVRSNQLFCWGYNAFGQVGTGSSDFIIDPPVEIAP